MWTIFSSSHISYNLDNFSRELQTFVSTISQDNIKIAPLTVPARAPMAPCPEPEWDVVVTSKEVAVDHLFRFFLSPQNAFCTYSYVRH
jgi:hypothetical protein